MIFKMVVDYVISHWVTEVAPTKAGAEGLGETIQELAYFYADDELVMLRRPERFQREFNVFTYIFGQVGLYKKMQNMVIMTF